MFIWFSWDLQFLVEFPLPSFHLHPASLQSSTAGITSSLVFFHLCSWPPFAVFLLRAVLFVFLSSLPSLSLPPLANDPFPVGNQSRFPSLNSWLPPFLRSLSSSAVARQRERRPSSGYESIFVQRNMQLRGAHTKPYVPLWGADEIQTACTWKCGCDKGWNWIDKNSSR